MFGVDSAVEFRFSAADDDGASVPVNVPVDSGTATGCELSNTGINVAGDSVDELRAVGETIESGGGGTGERASLVITELEVVGGGTGERASLVIPVLEVVEVGAGGVPPHGLKT